jgi:hypothetical protein
MMEQDFANSDSEFGSPHVIKFSYITGIGSFKYRKWSYSTIGRTNEPPEPVKAKTGTIDNVGKDTNRSNVH